MATLLSRLKRSVSSFLKASSEPENPSLNQQRYAMPSHYLPKGSIGTPITSGYYDIEQINPIRGKDWYPIADAMVRSDATIRKNLETILMPIMTASYSVEAASDDPVDTKVKEFVEYVVFEHFKNPQNGACFKQFMFESVWGLSVDGNSPFEVIFKGVGNDPTWGNFIGIGDLAHLDPRTFEKYELNPDGSIDYIAQQDSNDLAREKGRVELPGWMLMILVNNKIGANWEGLSPLRSAYGVWQIKQDYLKTVQKSGRRSLGVPVLTVPQDQNNSTEQLDIAKNIVKAFTDTNGRVDGIVLPQGFALDQFNISSDKTANSEVLKYLDGEIDKAFMASFASRDSSGGGSRAAREDASKDFYRAIEAIPKNILEVFNLRVVRPIVDAKFGKQMKYPKVTVSGIVGRDMLTEAQLLQILATGQLIRVDDRLRDWVHERFDLPDYVTEAETRIIDNTPAPAANPLPAKASLTNSYIDEKGLRWRTFQLPKEGNELISENINRILNKPKITKILSEHVCTPECGALHGNARIEAAAKYPAYALIDDGSKELQALLEDLQTSRAKDLIAKIETTLTKLGVSKGSKEVVSQFLSGDLKMPDVSTLRATLAEHLAGIADQAHVQAHKEVGVKPPIIKAAKRKKTSPSAYASTLSSDQIQTLQNNVGLLTSSLDDAAQNAVFFTIQNRAAATDSVAQLIADIQAAVNDSLASKLANAAVNAVASTVNSIRNDVFLDKNISELISVYRFVNPAPESAICRSLAGRIFSKEEYATSPYLPPLHWNCKSIVVPITVSENENGRYKPDAKGLTPSATEGYSQEEVLKSAQWVG